MRKLLDEGAAHSFDMIFVDAGSRERYGAIHELAMQLVHVGGAVVYYDTLWPADSVLQHGYYPAMRDFNYKLAKDPRVLASLVPLSYGITIAMKSMDLEGGALQAARDAMETSGDDGKMRELLKERRSAVQAEIDAMP
jgi:hypothetical protein